MPYRKSPLFSVSLRPFLNNLLSFLSIVILTASACAQSLADVHIKPHKTDETNSIATRADAEFTNVHTGPIRVNVDLVLVPVTVIDQKNRTVSTLDRGHFTLLEGQKPQEIRYFSQEDAPISVGLIVDISGSMANKADVLHEAVREFFLNANPNDDYFVVTVSDTPKVLADTTQSIGTIEGKLASMPAGGRTALLDGIYLAETKLRYARYRRRALVVISDGADNVSRYNLKEIKSFVQENDAQIYALGIFDGIPVFRTIEERFGRHLLDQVTEVTGGRTLSVDNLSKLPEAAATVSRELRAQYVLGYHPKDGARDGKWRKITVKVTPPEADSRLQAFYKKGYSAPEN